MNIFLHFFLFLVAAVVFYCDHPSLRFASLDFRRDVTVLPGTFEGRRRGGLGRRGGGGGEVWCSFCKPHAADRPCHDDGEQRDDEEGDQPDRTLKTGRHAARSLMADRLKDHGELAERM